MTRTPVFGALLRARLAWGVPLNWLMVYGAATFFFLVQLREWRVLIPVLVIHLLARWMSKHDHHRLNLYQYYSMVPLRLMPRVSAERPVRRPKWLGGSKAW